MFFFCIASKINWINLVMFILSNLYYYIALIYVYSYLEGQEYIFFERIFITTYMKNGWNKCTLCLKDVVILKSVLLHRLCLMASLFRVFFVLGSRKITVIVNLHAYYSFSSISVRLKRSYVGKLFDIDWNTNYENF